MIVTSRGKNYLVFYRNNKWECLPKVLKWIFKLTTKAAYTKCFLGWAFLLFYCWDYYSGLLGIKTEKVENSWVNFLYYYKDKALAYLFPKLRKTCCLHVRYKCLSVIERSFTFLGS